MRKLFLEIDEVVAFGSMIVKAVHGTVVDTVHIMDLSFTLELRTFPAMLSASDNDVVEPLL